MSDLFVELYRVQSKTEFICPPSIAKSSKFKMKDIIANRNLINKDTIFKEVVIIGEYRLIVYKPHFKQFVARNIDCDIEVQEKV